MASVAKGFPEANPSAQDAAVPPRVEVFRQIAEAVLVSLNTLKQFRIIRDAVSTQYLPD